MRVRIDYFFGSKTSKDSPTLRRESRVVGEFLDGALMRDFGGIRAGLVPSPSIIADEPQRQAGVDCLGSLEGTHARFFAVTVER